MTTGLEYRGLDAELDSIYISNQVQKEPIPKRSKTMTIKTSQHLNDGHFVEHFHNLPAEQYHKDALVPVGIRPAISASRANAFYNKSPGHMMHDFLGELAKDEAETKKANRVGTAAHSAILRDEGWESSLGLVAALNWTTKAAKEDRDALLADGITPLNVPEYEEIKAMRASWVRSEMSQHLMMDAESHVESSVGWTESIFDSVEDAVFDDGGLVVAPGALSYKCRPDYLPSFDRMNEGAPAIDYKTTADLDRFEADSLFSFGLGIRVALYYTGIKMLYPNLERFHYCFLVQEKKAPYLIRGFFMNLSDDSDDKNALDILAGGEARLEKVKEQWRACAANNFWPFPLEVSGFSKTGRAVENDPVLNLSKKVGISQ